MNSNAPSVIRRPDKGHTIAGTRVTLYALLDYLHANWTHDEIREWLNLTEDQLRVALEYIADHQHEVEAEYAEVLRTAAERRRYWEERLRDHLARNPPSPPSLEKAALYAKLAEQRGQIIRELLQEGSAEPGAVASGATGSGLPTVVWARRAWRRGGLDRESRDDLRDSKTLAGGPREDLSAAEREQLEREWDEDERERAACVESWKAMYRQQGKDPETVMLDWGAVFAERDQT